VPLNATFEFGVPFEFSSSTPLAMPPFPSAEKNFPAEAYVPPDPELDRRKREVFR